MVEHTNEPQAEQPKGVTGHLGTANSPEAFLKDGEITPEGHLNLPKGPLWILQKNGKVKRLYLTGISETHYICGDKRISRDLWQLVNALVPNPEGRRPNNIANIKLGRDKKKYEALAKELIGSPITGTRTAFASGPLDTDKPIAPKKSSGFCPKCMRLLSLCECGISSDTVMFEFNGAAVEQEILVDPDPAIFNGAEPIFTIPEQSPCQCSEDWTDGGTVCQECGYERKG